MSVTLFDESNVVQLRKKPKPQIPAEPRWYCVGCDSRVFQVLASGDIYCDGCKLPIATIKAVRV